MMTTILEGTGLVMLLLGAAGADSQSIMIPIMMMAAGMVLMYIGYKNEWRWN